MALPARAVGLLPPRAVRICHFCPKELSAFFPFPTFFPLKAGGCWRAGARRVAVNFQPPPRSGLGCARSYPISLTSARTPFPHRGWISLELAQLSWKLFLSRTCGFQSAALTGTEPSARPAPRALAGELFLKTCKQSRGLALPSPPQQAWSIKCSDYIACSWSPRTLHVLSWVFTPKSCPGCGTENKRSGGGGEGQRPGRHRCRAWFLLAAQYRALGKSSRAPAGWKSGQIEPGPTREPLPSSTSLPQPRALRQRLGPPALAPEHPEHAASFSRPGAKLHP